MKQKLSDFERGRIKALKKWAREAFGLEAEKVFASRKAYRRCRDKRAWKNGLEY